jgi:integrase
LEGRAYRYNVTLCRDPFLWSGIDDGSAPFKPDWLSHIVRLAANDAGVSATLHDLRHAFASWHVGNETPITDVQAMLGHGSLATTSIYLHGDTGRQRKAIDRMQLPVRKALGAAPEDRP